MSLLENIQIIEELMGLGKSNQERIEVLASELEAIEPKKLTTKLASNARTKIESMNISDGITETETISMETMIMVELFQAITMLKQSKEISLPQDKVETLRAIGREMLTFQGSIERMEETELKFECLIAFCPSEEDLDISIETLGSTLQVIKDISKELGVQTPTA